MSNPQPNPPRGTVRERVVLETCTVCKAPMNWFHIDTKGVCDDCRRIARERKIMAEYNIADRVIGIVHTMICDDMGPEEIADRILPLVEAAETLKANRHICNRPVIGRCVYCELNKALAHFYGQKGDTDGKV